MNLPLIHRSGATAWLAGFTFGLLMASTAHSAEGAFEDKAVGVMFGGDTRSCVFFQLIGVPEAVAAVPGSPWFVLPKSHAMFKETFALLLTAKAAGQHVNVVTTGGVNACGHAEVLRVAIP